MKNLAQDIKQCNWKFISISSSLLTILSPIIFIVFIPIICAVINFGLAGVAWLVVADIPPLTWFSQPNYFLANICFWLAGIFNFISQVSWFIGWQLVASIVGLFA